MAKNLEFVFMALFRFSKSWAIEVGWLRVDFQRIVSIEKSDGQAKTEPPKQRRTNWSETLNGSRAESSVLKKKIRVVLVG